MGAQELLQKIPSEVSYVTKTLEEAGYEVYLVGGCVRDLVMGRLPKDWDVTTNASPEKIVELFEKTVYENAFGTVAVMVLPLVSHETEDKGVTHETKYKTIEVTPYRLETSYSDFRHPDNVRWSDKLEDDLKRRDFAMNALALDSKGQIIDLYDGLKDIKDKTVRAVGNPDERLKEDALRMLRAVRFSCQLDFSIAYEVTESIVKNADLVRNISPERIRDEFVKIALSPNLAGGIAMLEKLGLLTHIAPEFLEGIGCEQSGEHVHDVWNHLLLAGQHAANKGWPLHIRLAALFHDIGKPRTRRLSEDKRKKMYTFYGHEVVGARIARKIMERLKFPKKETDTVEMLVRNHMFFSDTDKITLSAVRRIIRKVAPAGVAAGSGEEHPVWDLMKLRECDRVGMNKKEAPYRLRKYFAMIEEALRDPVSVSQLTIDGIYLRQELGIAPGPRMGWILHALLEEVLEDPKKNTVAYLGERALALEKLSDSELKRLGEQAKEKKEDLEEREIEKLHSKHGVKKQDN